jgi:hypothetical protein
MLWCTGQGTLLQTWARLRTKQRIDFYSIQRAKNATAFRNLWEHIAFQRLATEKTKQETCIREMFRSKSSPRHRLFLLRIFAVYTLARGECWDSVSNRPRLVTSKSFPVRHFLQTLQFAMDIPGVLATSVKHMSSLRNETASWDAILSLLPSLWKLKVDYLTVLLFQNPGSRKDGRCYEKIR